VKEQSVTNYIRKLIAVLVLFTPQFWRR